MFSRLNKAFCYISLFFILFCQSNFVLAKTDINEPVRVLISDSGFSHKNLSMTSSKPYFILVDGQLILNPIGETTFTNTNCFIQIKNETGSVSIPANKKIIIKPDKNELITFTSIKKNGTLARYKGDFEITGQDTDKLRVINIVNLEDYLKGVVPNEMPVHFGLEALKAQAVAARGYVFRENVSNDFDVYDSVSSQVYRGENSRKAVSDMAVNQTSGQFALYNDKIILSLYSSTSGGATENYENVFSTKMGNSTHFPSNPVPYLKSVKDYPDELNLTKNEDAEKFYTQSPKSFDINSPLYRWHYSWTKDELEQILTKNLIKYKSEFIKPNLTSAKDFGELKNIEVIKRGQSGKAMYVKITTSKGMFYIAKEIMIRKIFEYNKKWLPSANVVFKPVLDNKNNLTGFQVFGGGYGHGVGMSQFGAGFMAQNGYSYKNILQHYYKGISIATFPVTCENKKLTDCKIDFYTQSTRADLVIIAEAKSPMLTFNINGEKLSVKASGKSRFDIEKYLKKGLNNIYLEEINHDLFGFSTVNNLKFYVELEGANE